MMSGSLRSRVVMAMVVQCAIAAAGCGYALAGRGSFLPAYIKVVDIPELVNRTAFTGIEGLVTQKIREEFIGRGRYKVRSGAAVAQALLSGEILSVQQVAAGTTDVQLASRYRFTVTMKVAFTDLQSNKVLWSNDALAFTDEYQLTVPGPVEGGTFTSQQRSTAERMAADAARTVVTGITEAF